MILGIASTASIFSNPENFEEIIPAPCACFVAMPVLVASRAVFKAVSAEVSSVPVTPFNAFVFGGISVGNGPVVLVVELVIVVLFVVLFVVLVTVFVVL